MGSGSRFYPEVKDWAVRLVFEQVKGNDPTWPAIITMAAKIGCTLSRCSLQAQPAGLQIDRGLEDEPDPRAVSLRLSRWHHSQAHVGRRGPVCLDSVSLRRR
jgi:hypothetical protein